MAQFLTPGLLQLLDASGTPYSGAKMYVYQSGTTTALNLYSDEALSTPATNPIVADASGIFPNIFLAQTKFKAVITDADDVTIKSLDPVYSTGASDNISAANVSFDGTGIGFSADDVQEAIEEIDSAYAALSGAAFTGEVSITRSVAGTFLRLTSTDADTAVGPVIEMYRNSATPADNDALGAIQYYGENDASEKILYADVRCTSVDVSDGTEDGTFVIRTIVDGTFTNRIHVGAGLYTQGVTGGDKGAGTINAGTLYQAGQAIPFSKSYESAEQTITTSSVTTLTHGLGEMPKLTFLVLRCKTAENGYAVGDEVNVAGFHNPSTTDGTSSQPGNLSASTNFLYLTTGSHIGLPPKAGGLSTTITAGNWRFVARAWA